MRSFGILGASFAIAVCALPLGCGSDTSGGTTNNNEGGSSASSNPTSMSTTTGHPATTTSTTTTTTTTITSTSTTTSGTGGGGIGGQGGSSGQGGGMGGAQGVGGSTSAQGGGGSGPGTGGAGTGGASSSSTGGTVCKEVTVGKVFRDATAPNFYFAAPSQVDAAQTDVLSFQFESDTTGTIDLAAPPNDNAGTCNECVFLFADVDAAGTPKKIFYPVSGTWNIDASSDPQSFGLVGTLTNVKLVEVTVAADNTSTPVVGGECLHITTATANLPTAPTAWTCNPANYGGGDECDCACGAVDPDCTDMTLEVYNCGFPHLPAAKTSTCDASGACQKPAAWTCGASRWNDSTCDCNCGAEDIDCDFLATNSSVAANDCTGAKPYCGQAGTCIGATGRDTCAGSTGLTHANTVSYGTLAGATNNFDPGSLGCTGKAEAGPDVFYSIPLNAGDTLLAVAGQVTGDVGLYLLDGCGPTPAPVCVAGVDATGSGEFEQLSFTATKSGTYHIVVDTSAATDTSNFVLWTEVYGP